MMREETFTGKKNRFDDKNHFIQSLNLGGGGLNLRSAKTSASIC